MERVAEWVKALLLLAAAIAMCVLFVYYDAHKDDAAYEKGRQAVLAEVRRATPANEARQRQAIDRVRHDCEEECEDSLARQRGVLVEQIEECQGELVVSRQNERR